MINSLKKYIKPYDKDYERVKTKVFALRSTIPLTSLSPVRDEAPTTLLQHLVNEMLEVVKRPKQERQLIMSKSKNDFSNDFHDFYLEPASSYRFLEEWMSYPYGLAYEALLEKKVKCPRCDDFSLHCTGGSSLAWGDLRCHNCPKVLIEIKSKSSKFIERHFSRTGKMNAGSHRWYISQERAGYKHYLIVAPSDVGGPVRLHEIEYVYPIIEKKFCAFMNSDPENASLKSCLRARHIQKYGTVTTEEIENMKQEAKEIVDAWTTIYFGHFARVLQKFFKKIQP